jgi:ubiquitin-like protein Pup
MPEREQIQKTPQKRKEQESTETSTPSAQGDKIKGELDELLDEIDSVLETNAEEFVKSYIQKGGE